MSYSVTYGQDFFPKSKTKNKMSYPKAAILAGIVVLGAVLLSVPQIRTSVQKILLPGDGAVTGQAMEAFAADMKSGTPFDEAARSFCLEILKDG